MSPAEREVIRRKLDRIIKSLRRIRAAQAMNVADFLADEDLQTIMERHLELVIGAAVDLNVHIVTRSGFSMPADAYSSFLDLSRHTGAISAELAEELAPATGLRNRIAHEYDDLDLSILFDGLFRALELFPRYVEAVEAYLADMPTTSESGKP